MTDTLDTLSLVRELEASGMTRQQAEAIAEAIWASQGDLATKADIGRLERGMKTDLRTAATDLRVALCWIALAAVVANAAVTFGLLALLAFLAGVPEFSGAGG